MRIDSHQHFWYYDPVEYDWIDETMQVIAKDQLPDDLAPVLRENGFDGCVAVQARQEERETNFLLNIAEKHDFVKAVVGWIDLRAEDLKEKLKFYSGFPKLKGFRHVLQGEEPSFMLEPEFLRGIAALAEFGFSYDILIFPRHLPAAIELVKQFPKQAFVLDHIAKPFIRSGKDAGWKDAMQQLAQMENVSCKISGMVTEGNWNDTRPELFRPYIQHVLDVFGNNRVMFGSDWPVCKVAATYEQVVSILEMNTTHLSSQENEMLWGDNARRFYRID